MALNDLLCDDVPLRNYSLTHSLTVFFANKHLQSFTNKWGVASILASEAQHL